MLCLQVGAADVAAVVAAWTGIPVEALTAADAARLQRLPETLAVSALSCMSRPTIATIAGCCTSSILQGIVCCG